MGTPKKLLARLISVKQPPVVLILAIAAPLLLCMAFGQKPFREYPGVEYENFPRPSDWQVPGEWTFARLMYPSSRRIYDRPRDNWLFGGSNWTIDYPRSDRHLSEAVRRLTRIQTRSIEQPVNLDDGDDVYNWPWLYGVEVGHWDLTDAQAAKMRDFLLRGGFFMCDDFHGTEEWEIFIESMSRVFPITSTGWCGRSLSGLKAGLPSPCLAQVIILWLKYCCCLSFFRPTVCRQLRSWVNLPLTWASMATG